jgi:hypothetical protein
MEGPLLAEFSLFLSDSLNFLLEELVLVFRIVACALIHKVKDEVQHCSKYHPNRNGQAGRRTDHIFMSTCFSNEDHMFYFL